MIPDLSTLTATELASERETARRDLLRGVSGGLEYFAAVCAEFPQRSARMAPLWADRIGYPSAFDERVPQWDG